jgi:cellobiose dehydrogenase (acceptor)
MKRSFLLSLGLVVLRATAQNASPYTDKFSDIKFNGYIHPSGFTIGIAVPGNYTTDFIAQFVAPVTNDGGWAGFTMGAAMVDTLAVVAWPHEGKIISSFRKAT